MCLSGFHIVFDLRLRLWARLFSSTLFVALTPWGGCGCGTQATFESKSVQGLFDSLKARDPDQPEFLQAVQEVLETMEPVFEKYPQVPHSLPTPPSASACTPRSHPVPSHFSFSHRVLCFVPLMAVRKHLRRAHDALDTARSAAAADPQPDSSMMACVPSMRPSAQSDWTDCWLPQYLPVMERLAEPERMIAFRVPWVDDKGKQQVSPWP